MNIIGRVTKNAQINTLTNSKKVVNFSIAINDNYKNKQGERVELTTYYNCSYWISPNVAKILTKGTLVELTGRASSNAWIGKDGEIKSGLNFHTSNIKLYGGGEKSKTERRPTAKPQKNEVANEDNEDDLPF
ncbi:MAG: single-stranded DNA-binding protein [Chryseobacterium sp.]|uniref:single-stranded DNA-binding protein n=1 Tax=Chryseobacterium sp. TaxID=1871047 RepID=UPI001B0ADF25|nr:single-stranded DNA-binding protein [Chryseobacterium sp.]MBO6186726.1 single-stranded DNA-binding protein [Chryseobacterium sp.]